MTTTEAATILRHYNLWRRGNLEGMPQPDPREIGEAIDAAIEMIESAEEDRALCNKLADILTRTANVLKGDPRPLNRHGWHDLPEVAQKLVAAAGQNTINAMLAHSRKTGKQRARKPLAKHAKEAMKP